MQLGKGVFATTLPDKEEGVMPLSVLEQMVIDINSRWLTIGIEHDPRIPPQGRILNARLVQRDDGSYAVEGEVQAFEADDIIPYNNDKNEIPQREVSPGTTEVYRDKAYQDPILEKLTDELATLLGAQVQEEFKYSIEPLSVLTIAAGFIGLSLATGFIQKMGEDLSDKVRAKLKEIFSGKKNAKDQLLLFLYSVRYPDRTVSAEVILTNPTHEEIDSFFSSGQYELARVLPRDIGAEHTIRQITYQYQNKTLRLCFAVRADGVPIFPVSRDVRKE